MLILLVHQEGVPATDFIVFANAALDELCKHLKQLSLLLRQVVRPHHEGKLGRHGLDLQRVLNLLGQLLAALPQHVVSVDAGDFAQQICLVVDALVLNYICQQVLLLDV